MPPISRRTKKSSNRAKAKTKTRASDVEEKYRKWRHPPVPYSVIGLVVVCFLYWIASGFGSDKDSEILVPKEQNVRSVSSTQDKVETAARDNSKKKKTDRSRSVSSAQEKSGTWTREAAKKKFMNCTIKFVPPEPRTEESEWRKPLWIAAHPASGSASPSKKGDLLRDLIDKFTGLTHGTKNYHMSVRNNKLKRCKGMTETAACSQVHPMVPIEPEKQTENFQSSVIFPIRNIDTVFPAFLTDKAIAYHNKNGQAPENEWRQQRDEYLKGSIDAWIDMIDWWRKSKDYDVALYVPYEELLDPQTGPLLVQRLADVFKDAGFEVAPEEDIPCIWFQVINEEWDRQEQIFQYIPGYKASQKKLMEEELKKYGAQLGPDEDELARILDSYITAIRDKTKLDF